MTAIDIVTIRDDDLGIIRAIVDKDTREVLYDAVDEPREVRG